MLPNTLRRVIPGFLLLQASCGVFSHTLLVGERLDKLVVVAIASAQNSFGILLLLSILRAMLRMVRFFLSATPFCWGDLGTVSDQRMPFCLQNSWKSLEVNLPPRLDRMALISIPLSFYTAALNFLNTPKNFDLCFKKYTHVFLEKSSMKRRK